MEESYLRVLNKIRAIHHEWSDWLDARKHEFAAYTFLAQDVCRWGKETSNAVENVNEIEGNLHIRHNESKYLDFR